MAYVPWVIRARDLLGVSLEPYPRVDGLARPARGAAVRRGRDRGRRGPVSDVTRDELARRLGEEGLVVLDVRTAGEFVGRGRLPVRRQAGSPPGARNVDLQELSAAADAAAIRALVGAPEGSEVIAYCHSGGRSAMAVAAASARRLRRAQLSRLMARVGARAPELPVE